MPADPNFEAIVDAVKGFAETSGAGTRNADKQRAWLNFKDQGGGGKFDFPAIHKVLNRDGANAEYIKARNAKDSKGVDIHLPKLSADFLACMERDYRMRNRSRIRMFVHASARLSANGQDNGPLRRNTVDWLAAILKEEAKKAQA